MAAALRLYNEGSFYCPIDGKTDREFMRYVMEEDLAVYKKALFEHRGRETDRYIEFMKENIGSDTPLCCSFGRSEGKIGNGFFTETTGNYYYVMNVVAPKISINESDSRTVSDKYIVRRKTWDKCGHWVNRGIDSEITKTDYNRKIDSNKIFWKIKNNHAGK